MKMHPYLSLRTLKTLWSSAFGLNQVYHHIQQRTSNPKPGDGSQTTTTTDPKVNPSQQLYVATWYLNIKMTKRVTVMRIKTQLRLIHPSRQKLKSSRHSKIYAKT